jgi:hypothetical protein
MVDTGNNNLFPSALALLVLVVVVCCVADPSNGRLCGCSQTSIQCVL